jgi:hypothetical protein
MLLSPVDWALMESWKEAGIPLEAVLTGIERTFENWRKRPRRFQKVNSLGFCSQEVMRAADNGRAAGIQRRGPGQGKEGEAPFSAGDIISFLTRNAQVVEQASSPAAENGSNAVRENLAFAVIALRQLASQIPAQELNLENIERELTVLEEKLLAGLICGSCTKLLSQVQAEVERSISPYRGKMTPAQIDSLQRQFLKKRLFEHYGIPRLSLFYL